MVGESSSGKQDLKEGKNVCPNCGADVDANFCHECGQNQKASVRPIDVVFKDVFLEALNLDNRFFTSFKYLLFKPGFLTNEYISGKRNTYSSPLRLFILISAIYFAVLVLTDTSVLFAGLMVNPTATEGLKEWLPRLMFMLMPVFAIVLKIIYFRTGKYYTEHLIFSLHYFSFLFLTMICLTLLRWPLSVTVPDIRNSPWWIVVPDGTLQILPLIYLFISLKRTYKQKTIMTIYKTVLILIVQIIFLLLCGDVAESIWK